MTHLDTPKPLHNARISAILGILSLAALLIMILSIPAWM
jgi:hypothetical protein